MKQFLTLLLLFCALAGLACKSRRTPPPPPPTILFGIVADPYRVEMREVEPGQTLGHILDGYGIFPRQVYRLEQAADSAPGFKKKKIGT